MTFGTICTRVRAQVIDLPTVVTNAVPGYVRTAIRKLQVRHNFLVQDRLLVVTTTAGTAGIGSVPSDWKEWRSWPYYLTNDGRARKLTMHTPHEGIYPDIRETETNPPRVITIGEPSDDNGTRAMIVAPIPDGASDWDDGEYRIYIPYIRYLTALSADGDSNWFTTNAEEYIFHFATNLAFEADWDYDHAAVELQLAENEYKEVVLADKRLRLSDVQTLVVHKDVYDNELRW